MRFGGNGSTQYTLQNLITMIVIFGILLLLYYFVWHKRGKDDGDE
ncbi:MULTISPECIES: hypothetical protein [Sphingomonadales]|uniref:Uncharacterized protein n=1 Tax=Edaphosphingomonas haloaromaticamans TaxID=653954 RepID=A0A1S1HIZ4_9SPHN|nr:MULTISPECIES: hypothetical protein [Sphingomonas]MDX3884156.1 hypothetical protein [Sphingomonas sp.]OHT22269.1 hypothetical protein BHE75_04295 [Sphingomonas haloaromaticamans]